MNKLLAVFGAILIICSIGYELEGLSAGKRMLDWFPIGTFVMGIIAISAGLSDKPSTEKPRNQN